MSSAPQAVSTVVTPLHPANGVKPGVAPATRARSDAFCPDLPVPIEGEQDDHKLASGLAALAPLVPGIAAVATTLTYVLGLGWQGKPWVGEWEDNVLAIAFGLGMALGVWVLLAWRFGHFSAPDHANASSYGLLRTRLSQLQARHAVFCAPGRLGRASQLAACAACHEAAAQCQAVAADLRSSGLQWVLATGYDTQWRRLHRAEEALLEVEPFDTLRNEALYDCQRLRGSGLKDLEQLKSQLSWVLGELQMADCTVPAPPTTGATGQQSSNGIETPPGDERRNESQVRAILRQIRYSVNDFRERQTAGLIRARNRLLKTIVGTSIASYLLLALAIAVDAPVETIAGVAACYLVGAAVGLFNRMRLESRQDSGVEDYGLTVARLIHTPLFSGLAAVAGVFLTAALAAPLVGEPVTEPALSLIEVFDVEASPFALVVAAVFGLTPDLVTSRLRDQTERLTENLRNTQPVSSTQDGQAAV